MASVTSNSTTNDKFSTCVINVNRNPESPDNPNEGSLALEALILRKKLDVTGRLFCWQNSACCCTDALICDFNACKTDRTLLGRACGVAMTTSGEWPECVLHVIVQRHSAALLTYRNRNAHLQAVLRFVKESRFSPCHRGLSLALASSCICNT